MTAIAHRPLLMPLIACLAASLFHFTHNAEFLGSYPNMPASITRADVYLAWITVAVIGVAGYVLYSCRYRKSGLLFLVAFAFFGFDGFAHYGLASMSAHTLIMNLTIWLEAAAAGWLLISVIALTGSMRRREA